MYKLSLYILYKIYIDYSCTRCYNNLNKSNITNTKHIDNSIDFTLSGKSVIMMIAYKTASIKKAVMIMEVMEMTEKEQIQKNVEEFSRLQDSHQIERILKTGDLESLTPAEREYFNLMELVRGLRARMMMPGGNRIVG